MKPLVMISKDSCTINLVTLRQTLTFNSSSRGILSVEPVDSTFRMEDFISAAQVVVKLIPRNSLMLFLVVEHAGDEVPREVRTYKCMSVCHSKKLSMVHQRICIYGIK